jgi:TRAP-type C4-dicarboxylate transport system permease small subunit
VRRVFTIVASAALVVLMALSLPATWHYVAFMRREHSAYLGMRFDVLYSIYVVFAVVAIGRQARVAWRAWRSGALPESTEPIEDHTA